ncbi:hypothetical protein F4780DRAFT_564761 [Xylariomycetidae sp. FL0641]|nr:hypothetical protein F4780DRAFT_564761 [Xylariomycetidae sp. FL0641]
MLAARTRHYAALWGFGVPGLVPWCETDTNGNTLHALKIFTRRLILALEKSNGVRRVGLCLTSYAVGNDGSGSGSGPARLG